MMYPFRSRFLANVINTLCIWVDSPVRLLTVLSVFWLNLRWYRALIMFLSLSLFHSFAYWGLMSVYSFTFITIIVRCSGNEYRERFLCDPVTGIVFRLHCYPLGSSGVCLPAYLWRLTCWPIGSAFSAILMVAYLSWLNEWQFVVLSSVVPRLFVFIIMSS